MNIIERFNSKWIIDPETGCWLWFGTFNHKGYGEFWDKIKIVRAHRFSYELHCGYIPIELEIDHLCRVRHCVNPNHLEVVTHQENILRSISFNVGNLNKIKTHCPKGHPYSDSNLVVQKNESGGIRRKCRICINTNQNKRYQLKSKGLYESGNHTR